MAEQRVTRPFWVLVFVLGGVGSLAVLSAWKPEATGGGSSDAVAALLGACVLLLVVGNWRTGWEWTAQLYAVFFVAYLTTLDLAGLIPSIIVGNLLIVAFFVARRALRSAALARACLTVVLVGGVVMTLSHDGHGTGILAGTAATSLMLVRRRQPDEVEHVDS